MEVKIPQASDDDLNYADSAAAAMLIQSPKGGRLLLWIICLLITAFIVWAAFAEIDEFTRGEGRVIPSQYVQMVQNLEGGIVAEIFVKEGQQVSRGEPLVRLDDTRFSSSLRESDVTQFQLKARAARLNAEAKDQTFPEETLLAEGVPANIVETEKNLFNVRERELNNNKQVLKQQSLQKQQELSEWKAKLSQFKRSYGLLNRELKMTEPLVAQGAISQVEVLRIRRQLNDIYGEIETADLTIPRIEAALQEIEEKLSVADSSFRSQAQLEYSETKSELSRLTESSQALVDRVNRTVISSPVNGTIKQLFVKTLGGVIQPGLDIVAIVPNEENLRVEAKVSPADIAFLYPGQEATIKFTAYDFAIHGGLSGKLVNISPDTILDEEGESFYLVQIETEQAFFGAEDRPLPIIPGMTVHVDILTGKKTILDYILKPLLKTKQLALKER